MNQKYKALDNSIYRHIKIIRLDPIKNNNIHNKSEKIIRNITQPQLSIDQWPIDKQIKVANKYQKIKESQHTDQHIQRLKKVRKQYSEQIMQVQNQIMSIFKDQSTGDFKQPKRLTKMTKEIKNQIKLFKGKDKYRLFYQDLSKDSLDQQLFKDEISKAKKAQRQLKQSKIHFSFINYLKQRKLRVPRIIKRIQHSQNIL